MAKNKTTENNLRVADFLNTISDQQKRADCIAIAALISKATGFEPKMWGTSIVGFGSYHYKYESGREGDAPLAGFSPRAAAIVLYLSGHFEKREELLEKFGKYKTGKACVYLKTLADINTDILTKMVIKSVQHIRKLYPSK